VVWLEDFYFFTQCVRACPTDVILLFFQVELLLFFNYLFFWTSVIKLKYC